MNNPHSKLSHLLIAGLLILLLPFSGFAAVAINPISEANFQNSPSTLIILAQATDTEETDTTEPEEEEPDCD